MLVFLARYVFIERRIGLAMVCCPTIIVGLGVVDDYFFDLCAIWCRNHPTTSIAIKPSHQRTKTEDILYRLRSEGGPIIFMIDGVTST